MADRRVIQKKDERFFVNQFLDWFNRAYRCRFQVISEPDPPEAIIRSGNTTRWVEISTAFWNSAYAQDLYSYVAKDEVHKPVDSGPHIGMDHNLALNFVSVLKKKLEKKSYIPFRNKYGPGYLVVPIRHPWFDRDTIRHMKQEWSKCQVNDIGCFRSILIAYSSGNRFKFLRWPKNKVT